MRAEGEVPHVEEGLWGGCAVHGLRVICIGFYYFYRASERSIMMVTSIMSSVVWSLLQAFFYCFYGTEIKTKVRRGG